MASDIAGDSRPPWTVLLLGGASGTGKSSLSYPLSRRLGVPIVEVDDIVESLLAMTTPDEQPALHYWPTHPEAALLPPDGILQLHLAVAEALTPAFVAVIANHLETDMPLIFEGDYLVPSLAVRDQFQDMAAAGRVRSIFLDEPVERQLVANYAGREPVAGEQSVRAKVSVLFGAWLAAEAARHGVPMVRARPWSSLERRVLDLVG